MEMSMGQNGQEPLVHTSPQRVGNNGRSQLGCAGAGLGVQGTDAID